MTAVTMTSTVPPRSLTGTTQDDVTISTGIDIVRVKNYSAARLYARNDGATVNLTADGTFTMLGYQGMYFTRPPSSSSWVITVKGSGNEYSIEPVSTAAPVTGQGLNADTTVINTGVGTSGGAGITVETLRLLAGGDSYELINRTLYSDGAIQTATVAWFDGSTGTFTCTNHNTTFAAVDAYTITHALSGKTITQPAVTRDAGGNITVKPALTIV